MAWPTDWPSRRRAETDGGGRNEGWLLDTSVPRARDLRYTVDPLPLADESALVDRVLGRESVPMDRAPRDWVRDVSIDTHWTRSLSQDLGTQDPDFANGGTRSPWKIVRNAALALAAAYVFVYLMVAALIYLARVPDAASAPIPDAPAAPAPARSDFPLGAPAFTSVA
jgi:hypothetical protein